MRNIIFVLLAIILIEKKDKVLAEDDAYHFPGLAPGRLVFILSVLILMAVAISCNRPEHIQTDGTTYFYPGKGLIAIIFSNNGSTMYAPGDGEIAVIDVTTMEIINELDFDYDLAGMVIGPAEDYIYCTYYANGDGSGRIARIRISDGYTDSIDLSPVNVAQVAVDDSGDYVYAAGTVWPHIGVPVSIGEYDENVGAGRIIEIRTSDFSITRIANIGVANHGISYQNGKLVVMSPEQGTRTHLIKNRDILAFTCHIINVANLEIEYSVGVGLGYHNTSFALPGDDYVMAGWNDLGLDDMGMGLVNVNTGEVERWIATYTGNNPHPQREGGGNAMTVDESNNVLYSTLFYNIKDLVLEYYRIVVVDLNTYDCNDWYIQPFRRYVHIAYSPLTGKIYLTAPLDDAIVVLDPPEIVHTLVPPVACFTYYPVSGPSPLTVTIDNCSYDEDGEIVRIDCDWDADSQIDEVLQGNPAVLQHTFIEPGTNEFILTVVDNDDLETAWTGTVDVE